MNEVRCPNCGGLNGAHGFVHVRHPQGGGGSNLPCPLTRKEREARHDMGDEDFTALVEIITEASLNYALLTREQIVNLANRINAGRFARTTSPDTAFSAAGVAPQEPTLGKRLDPEFRAELIEFARFSIQAVWDDVPGGVDAATLAQNVVGAQELAWISRGFPFAPQPVIDEAALAVKVPPIPFGPEGVPADLANARYYRSAAKNIRYHASRGRSFSGSNLTEAVARLCDAAADALYKRNRLERGAK